MPPIPMNALLFAAYAVYGSILLLAFHFLRTTARERWSALAGGLAAAVAGLAIEAAAHALGWWSYTMGDTPIGPPAIYPALVIVFAFLALIGSRILRRFGLRGFAAYLLVLAIVGTARDFLIAGRLLKLAVFAPGPAMIVCDCLLWAGLTALATGVMRAIAKPAREPRS